jgi:meiotic recombination protein SPO11
LEVDLSEIVCSNDDDQGEPWNNHQITDENSCAYNEDEHEEIQLSDEILMIRERIWTVFACIGMGIVTDQEVIVRRYVQPQQNEPDASDICRNFLYNNQSRSLTSIVRLMEFVHQLFASNRCTTLRSLYYTLQSYFHNQEDCNRAIEAMCRIIASSKGLFCGSIAITRKGSRSGHEVDHYVDGSTMEIEGISINSKWIERNDEGRTKHGIHVQIISKNAKVILVIEQEGVFWRLAADRIFNRYPCILVTGKGFPDVATRALVHTLHRELRIPVVGLCDCNPFGVSLLSMYYDAGESMGIDGGQRFSVPIMWIGLKPSVVDQIKSNLPPDQLVQPLTENDHKKIDILLRMDSDGFVTDEVKWEVQDMRDLGVKVRLDALHWIGQDYMTNWIVNMLQNSGKVFSKMGDEATNSGNIDEVTHVSGRPSTHTSTAAKAKLEPPRKRQRSNTKSE